MRKIILGLAVSLDGFIEGPKGEYDWCFTDQDYGMTEFLNRIDSIFMGRKSFDLVKGMEGVSPWKDKTTYVFSNSLKKSIGTEILVTGQVLQQTKEIKAKPGKDIWLFGGAELTGFLMNHKFVDELWLSVHPVILGSGKSLFSGVHERTITQLIDTKRYSTGLVSLKYKIQF